METDLSYSQLRVKFFFKQVTAFLFCALLIMLAKPPAQAQTLASSLYQPIDVFVSQSIFSDDEGEYRFYIQLYDAVMEEPLENVAALLETDHGVYSVYTDKRGFISVESEQAIENFSLSAFMENSWVELIEGFTMNYLGVTRRATFKDEDSPNPNAVNEYVDLQERNCNNQDKIDLKGMNVNPSSPFDNITFYLY